MVADVSSIENAPEQKFSKRDGTGTGAMTACGVGHEVCGMKVIRDQGSEIRDDGRRA